MYCSFKLHAYFVLYPDVSTSGFFIVVLKNILKIFLVISNSFCYLCVTKQISHDNNN